MPAEGSSAIDVSLVICTRNRADRLQSCLAAVSRIRCHRRWAFAIVDNGSTDETAAVIGRFIQTNTLLGCYVFEPRPGLSYARNAGIAATTGEIIAFTDDDCYPEPDLLDSTYSRAAGRPCSSPRRGQTNHARVAERLLECSL